MRVELFDFERFEPLNFELAVDLEQVQGTKV